MQDLKDYVFYVIKKEGYNDGIKRGSSKHHNDYYMAFLDKNPLLFEDVSISYDWCITIEALAQKGDIILVNTAIEVDELKHRLYTIYLPSIPNLFQLNNLELHLEDFEEIPIDVGVYGIYEQSFRELRMENDFDSLNYLKGYIQYYKDKFRQVGYQKVIAK